jgi:hypothetical protein
MHTITLHMQDCNQVLPSGALQFPTEVQTVTVTNVTGAVLRTSPNTMADAKPVRRQSVRTHTERWLTSYITTGTRRGMQNAVMYYTCTHVYTCNCAMNDHTHVVHIGTLLRT